MAIGVWFSYSCRHVEENVLLSKGEEEDLWLAMKRRSTPIRARRLEDAAHLTRRSFIKATTAATALAAASSLTACAPATSDLAATGEDAEAAHPVGRDIVSGEWKTAACWHNCGGRCLNKVLVQDGVVVRQKTDDTHEDSPDYPQQRGCLRGRSQRKQVFAEDRIKYPHQARRAGAWTLPMDELRGKDEWERVSWDEALDLVAQGLTARQGAVWQPLHPAPEGLESRRSTRTMGAFGGFTNFWRHRLLRLLVEDSVRHRVPSRQHAGPDYQRPLRPAQLRDHRACTA